MTRIKVYLAVFSVALGVLWILPASMSAENMNKAALVIRSADQDIRAACVEFSEPEISGLELLQRSGLALELEAQGLGAIVCSIEQTGCPADDCWCQCTGSGDCIYWSYWHQQNGAWQYSQAGASTYAVSNGMVEGWSWGPGSANLAIAPPPLTFADVCTESQTEEHTPTASPTAILFSPGDTNIGASGDPLPADTATATQTPLPTIAATATVVPISSPTPTATYTPFPTATVQRDVTSMELSPQAVPTDTILLEPSPTDKPPVPTDTPPPGLAISKVRQPSPEATAVVAMADVSPAPRAGSQRTKELNDAPQRALAVIGAGIEPPLPRTGQPVDDDPRTQVDETSPQSSYMVLALIVAVLLGLLLLSANRRRKRTLYDG